MESAAIPLRDVHSSIRGLERSAMSKGFLLSLLLVLPTPLVAQSHDAMGGTSMHDHAAQSLSTTARRQIDSVARRAASLATTAAATNAGFHPVFGWIPTMGEHWVDRALMTRDKQLDLGAPSNLMFSKIAGRARLSASHMRTSRRRPTARHRSSSTARPRGTSIRIWRRQASGW